ncbi:MAG: Isopentenyl-diphosphate Delta-isomerase [Candidatus Magasanikbacteria bacterium GW2011_GWA2_56_11]|uniref:Isopentenyl-diphosphate Delta-isomerase n=1 Tax=Candidatus Magasanikbacteria bacterium GW2011_GWA2_56_11 TaxID=1619044 RepID=A0A0G1YE10_9BACT|nr:MAG: Isopentenyl-diphosphate Delta-isomerase [Candidatus Magasanikbacteria bacterium GW2011_GWA2_56_11]
MSKAKIIIVDEKDSVIGLKERGTLKPEDIYRVSALWIQNSKGDTLLAQRSFNKKHDPGKWGPAVAGTIDQGETYESNIIKEAEEEIGLNNCHFEKAFYKMNDGKHKHFVQWYFALLDKDIHEFTIQKEEVEQIKWFSREELLKKLADFPDIFLKSTKECVDYFSNNVGSGMHIT